MKSALALAGVLLVAGVVAAQAAEESAEPLTIVTMLCDSGVKYLSKIFNDDWLEEHDIKID